MVIGSYTEPEWEEFGLEIHPGAWLSGGPGAFERGLKAHRLVAQYLRRHPDAWSKYKADQSGELHYYDILDLAEKEEANGKEILS